jgi:integrase
MAKRTPKRAAKRSYGQGAVYRDSRGLWVGAYDRGRDANGKRDRGTVSSKDRATALAKLRAAQAAHDDGMPAPSTTLTTRAWLETWVRDIAPITAPKGAPTYAAVLRDWVFPHIGRTPLVKFQPEHWYRLNRILTERGLSASSRAKARQVLRRAFQVAMRDGKLARNVIALTDPIPLEHHTSDAMTAAQATRVLEYAHAQGDRLEALAVLVVALGLRQGEALDARWSDISGLDGPAPVIYVGRVRERVKSRASVRELPLPAMVVAALRDHWARQMDARVAADVWGDDDLVFTTTIGTRIHRRNCLRWWHDLTEGAGIGRRRFHASRHTAATVMLNATPPVPLETVSRILGHSRYAITSDIYAKPNAETLRGAANAVDAIYAPKPRAD